jgi:hypothetical protein
MVKWQALPNRNQTGRLVYYYSNQKAALPVRDVQKGWDEKADPNIETMTYGLFSTCTPIGRKNALEHGDEFLFFYTNREGTRMVTGYYEIGSYVVTGFVNRLGSITYHFPDYAFLARNVRFVKTGIPLGVHGEKRWERVRVRETGVTGYGYRTTQRISSAETKALKGMLDVEDDATADYVREIHRLEEENVRKFGFRYPTFQQGRFMKRLLSSGFNTAIMDNYVFDSGS